MVSAAREGTLDRLGPLAPRLRLFLPRPRMQSLSWMVENARTHEDAPYDHGAFPHIGAPGGLCDALDAAFVRTLWLMWGSRLGKTFFGQCALEYYADQKPCPMLFAGSDRKLATEVIARTYQMLGNCPPLRGQLRPEHLRRQDKIDLENCSIFVAWARSVSTLSDKGVAFGHANEIDKWEHVSTSTEADPLKLFDDRHKQYPARKTIRESTPSVKGHSRVERGLIASTNCRLWVPCPRCNRYQQLTMGEGKEPGGIFYDKTEAGKSDKELARKTAHYVCKHCEGKIENHHRVPMMRAGVWVPEGCGVDDEKAMAAAKARQAVSPIGDIGTDGAELWQGWGHSDWITGAPMRDGVDAGYQLSSLYALTLDWGDIAAEFVETKERPQNLRNFINQWQGLTWSVYERQQTWQQLGARIIAKDIPQGVVPVGFTFVTVGIDKQADHYAYVVEAWGEGRKSHTVDYGTCEDDEDLWSRVISTYYQHADGGEQLPVAFGLMDSGFLPGDVYDFCHKCCQAGRHVFPAKGTSKSIDVVYKESPLGKNTARPGAPMIHVDTIITQAWIERQLHTLKRGDAGCSTLFDGSLGAHQDFLEQLLNETTVFGLDTKNYTVGSWQRRDETIPNDYRDCRRLAYAAIERYTRGAPIRPRQSAQPKKSALIAGGGTRPDGRPWV